MNHLLKAALQYREWGLSVVPVLQDKRPPGSWREFQHRFMSEAEMTLSFTNPAVWGIAIVCGKISGNFEGLDIDSKYDLSCTLIDRFVHAIQEESLELMNRFVMVSTKNAGYHFYYRSDEIGRSQRLARRPSTIDERIANPKQKVKVLIETRSNGGIIIVPPTEGYEFLHNDLQKLPIIEACERQRVFAIAQSFDLFNDFNVYNPVETSEGYILTDDNPFYDYDRRGDINKLLIDNGWVFVGEKGPRTYFRRPGVTDKKTSGDFHRDLRLFTVFTTSSEFIPEKGYKPYAVYAILECGGDFKLAAKRLLADGFGISYAKRRQMLTPRIIMKDTE